MLEMLKMKPESRKEGRKEVSMAIWLAMSWFRAADGDQYAETQSAEEKDAETRRRRCCPARGTPKRIVLMTTAEDRVGETDDEIGDQLSDDQFGGLDGRRDELLHGAPVPLPGNGQGGEEGDDDGHDDGDQPGDEEVPRFQLRVVPDPAPGVDEGRDRRSLRSSGQSAR